MTIGRILFDSRFRDDGVVLSYTETETEGFEAENSVDWRDFSLFRLDTGGVNALEATLAADGDVDTFGYYIKEASTDYALRLEYESAPAVFTILALVDTSIDPLIGMKTFEKVTVLSGRKLRVRFFNAAVEDIRQLTAGVRLDFPIGQHQGIAPPNLRGEFVQSNTIGVNGSFLGRDKVRADIQGEIELEFVQHQTFIRDQWLDVMEHAERFAFFYAWNLDDFPDEVVFAWARSTPRPTNTGPATKMAASLPWSALAT